MTITHLSVGLTYKLQMSSDFYLSRRLPVLKIARNPFPEVSAPDTNLTSMWFAVETKASVDSRLLSWGHTLLTGPMIFRNTST